MVKLAEVLIRGFDTSDTKRDMQGPGDSRAAASLGRAPSNTSPLALQ